MSKCRNLIATTALATLAARPGFWRRNSGLGRPALPEEIEAWDVAVLPDGTGLPEGQGDVYDGEEAWINNCRVLPWRFRRRRGCMACDRGRRGEP